MTKTECKKLVLSMMALYSRFYPDPEGMMGLMTESWYLVLGDIPYQDAVTGLKWYARADTAGFPPSPGQIVHRVQMAREAADQHSWMGEGEAWSLVSKAIEDSAYHAEEQFSRLPPVIQRAVGSPSALRQMGQEEKLSVTRGQFARSYEQAVARTRAEASMPEEVRALAERTMERLEAGTPRPVMTAWIETRNGRTELVPAAGGWRSA